MILAAPLVIPFAKAVGLSVGTLGVAALADKVNDYIEANPEESMKILSTIIPNVGIGQIFMSKEDKISLEDLEDMTDEEAQDLTKEEKAELMKQAGKSGGKNKRQTMIDIAGKLGLGGEGKEKQDMEYEADERYDEGGVEDAPKPKFDYTKFFRKRRADGGTIGIEVLFREKKNLGGLLTGQAKNIYDTMSAAGYFTEDEIRNAIIGAGYEIPGASPAQSEQVTGIINQQLQTGGRGGDDNRTGFGKFGNLDPTTERTFVKDVYTIDRNAAPGAPMTGSFKPTEVTGYLNVNTGNYQTLEGKNINHAGLNVKPGIVAVAEALGLGPIDETQFTGLPYKEGQIAGTFTGKKLSDFNPLNLFKKQQATLADIQAMNKKAVDDLNAKLAAEKAAKEAAIAAEMARYNITSDSDFGGGVPGGGGGNVRTSGGDVYGGAAYGYNEAEEKTDYYKDGGLATMFVEKR